MRGAALQPEQIGGHCMPAADSGSVLAAERDHFIDNLFHPNGAEGLQAFFEKRAPRFR